MENNWFESWFDSPYYHLLYRDRNEQEAQSFLNILLRRIHLAGDSKVLDLACGKGRHSRHLHQQGLDVTGIDLSPENIQFCKQFENETLHFYEHDMRRLFRTNYFDAVFNLFTSFGYFDRPHENEQVIMAASKSLQPGGYFIIDFLNPTYAIQHLTASHAIELDGVRFDITKKIVQQKIIKEIHVTDGEKGFDFREEVRLIYPDDFQQFFAHAGLSVLETYGDYLLHPFQSEQSNRLIYITRKI